MLNMGSAQPALLGAPDILRFCMGPLCQVMLTISCKKLASFLSLLLAPMKLAFFALLSLSGISIAATDSDDTESVSDEPNPCVLVLGFVHRTWSQDRWSEGMSK